MIGFADFSRFFFLIFKPPHIQQLKALFPLSGTVRFGMEVIICTSAVVPKKQILPIFVTLLFGHQAVPCCPKRVELCPLQAESCFYRSNIQNRFAASGATVHPPYPLFSNGSLLRRGQSLASG